MVVFASKRAHSITYLTPWSLSISDLKQNKHPMQWLISGVLAYKVTSYPAMPVSKIYKYIMEINEN